MKQLLCLAIIFIINTSFIPLALNEYSVIKVIGGIYHTANNKALFTGDKILSNEKLVFSSQQSKAAIISKDKGRFMLTASATGVVNEGLMPALANISSRSGALINSMDLKKHFSDKYLILSGYEVEIGLKSFPMDDNHFFFLRFKYKGEIISKKIPFVGNKIKIDPIEILKVDGRPITLDEGTKAELVYRKNIEKTSELVAEFEPVFTDEKNLKNECKLIISEGAENQTNGDKKDQIFAYLTENYGKPLQENLALWLSINLNL